MLDYYYPNKKDIKRLFLYILHVKKYFRGKKCTYMIGNNISTLRKRLKITQDKLGEYLNVTPKTISRWENGDVDIPHTALSKMMELFNVSYEDLTQKKGKVLSFVNQKGGVSKTTLTIFFATMYAHQHHDQKVCIIDADFQQSAIGLYNKEVSEGETPLVDIKPFIPQHYDSPILDFQNLVDDCKDEYDLTVIDTVGSIIEMAFISTVMSLSDTAIIPVEPTYVTVESSKATISLLPSARERRERQKKTLNSKALIVKYSNNLESKDLASASSIKGVKFIKAKFKLKTVFQRGLSLVTPLPEFEEVYEGILNEL